MSRQEWIKEAKLRCWLRVSRSHGLIADDPQWLPEGTEPEIDRHKWVRAQWLDQPVRTH